MDGLTETEERRRMRKKERYSDSMETALSLRLLEMLLRNGIINQSTYHKVVKCYKRKEAA